MALALMGDPELAILDMPTISIDPPSLKPIWALIKQARGVVMTSASIQEADWLATSLKVIRPGKSISVIDAPLPHEMRDKMAYSILKVKVRQPSEAKMQLFKEKLCKKMAKVDITNIGRACSLLGYLEVESHF